MAAEMKRSNSETRSNLYRILARNILTIRSIMKATTQPNTLLLSLSRFCFLWQLWPTVSSCPLKTPKRARRFTLWRHFLRRWHTLKVTVYRAAELAEGITTRIQCQLRWVHARRHGEQSCAKAIIKRWLEEEQETNQQSLRYCQG